jgi:hypothetical protein
LDNFALKAAGARAACEALAGRRRVSRVGREAGEPPQAAAPALADAAGAFLALKGRREVFERPEAYAEGILDLMQAYAAAGRAEEVERLFYCLPRVPSTPALDEILSKAGLALAEAELAAGDTDMAEMACRGAFPDVPTFANALRRLKAARKLMSVRLADGDYAGAAELFMPFIPRLRRPSWAPIPAIGAQEAEREDRKRYERLLAVAAGSLFGFCEANGLFDEMADLYLGLGLLEGSAGILEARLELGAALVRLAARKGRLSEGMRYFGTLSCLSDLEGAPGLISGAMESLVEAYRETGDEMVVRRLIS